MKIYFEDNHVPSRGKYTNALVEDRANKKIYAYDECGAWLSWGVVSTCSEALDTTGLPQC